jgi:hypothetical protein
MERSSKFSERRLLQISADLLSQLAEIQKLRMAVQAAEARNSQTAHLRRTEVAALDDGKQPLRAGSI